MAKTKDKKIPAASLKKSWPWTGAPIKNSDMTEGKPKKKKK